jgi:hypothetical protein
MKIGIIPDILDDVGNVQRAIVDSIKETVYQGTLDPFPKALFVVMIN